MSDEFLQYELDEDYPTPEWWSRVLANQVADPYAAGYEDELAANPNFIPPRYLCRELATDTRTVLLLDIDGVLNSIFRASTQWVIFERPQVEALNMILDAVPELNLVISSAWTKLIWSELMTLKGFEYMLVSAGVRCRRRVVGYTKYKTMVPSREGQIIAWLNEHEVERYAILDDLKLSGVENFFYVPGELGLTPRRAAAVVRHFNGYARLSRAGNILTVPGKDSRSKGRKTKGRKAGYRKTVEPNRTEHIFEL